jgi:phosphate transport system substrate-binding protein
VRGVDRARHVRIIAAALVLAAWGSGSCAKSPPPRDEPPSTPIVLAGAEYVGPLLRAAILAFSERYPASDSIRIVSNGSAEGMEQLVNGDVTMSVLMRDLTDPEVEAAVRRDGLQSFPIAWDAVAVIVNPSCPLEQISRTELAAIYSGAVTDWAPLGWRGGGSLIALTSGPRLGMYAYLQQALLGGADYAKTVYAPPAEEDVVRTVATRSNAIGCVSLHFIEGSDRARVRVLRVAQAKALPSVPLDRETLLRRTYPLLKSISIATPAKPRQTASEFITFLSGIDGQAIVARFGYAPATVPVRIVRTAEEAE